MSFTLLRRNQLTAVPSPEKAVAFLEREGKSTTDYIPGRRGIIGSPEQVRAQVEELAVSYGADEVIVVTITHDHGVRRRSYELIAEAMSLQPRALSSVSA
jgi:alkanesulfonate monooxygenase SsuD/methylene tetrahydromethanopterin reductase-like flavin-dependent oxidoreductase (luciferase family)